MQFDNQSTKFFLENTSKIEASQSQLLISRALFEIGEDAELEAEKFIDFVFGQVQVSQN